MATMRALLCVIAVALLLDGVMCSAKTRSIDATEGIVNIEIGETVKGFLPGGSSQSFQTLFSSQLGTVESDNTFLHYVMEATEPNTCLTVNAPNRGLPTTQHYLRKNCTATDSLTIEVKLPAHFFQEGAWSAVVWAPHERVTYALTVANTTGPSLIGCPPNGFGVMAGPYAWEGFCWYLTLEGATCDATCHAIGGSNYIDYAQFAFDDPHACPGSCPDEPIRYFHAHGNPYNWLSETVPSQHRSLGSGTTNGPTSCHCGQRSGNGDRGGGAVVNDRNDDPHRALVCACFRLGGK